MLKKTVLPVLSLFAVTVVAQVATTTRPYPIENSTVGS